MKITDLFLNKDQRLLNQIQRDCSVYIEQAQKAHGWLYRDSQSQPSVRIDKSPAKTCLVSVENQYFSIHNY